MFSHEQKTQMLRLAKDSIGWGLRHGQPLAVNLADYDVALREPGACFVTLNRHGQLRGCIGSLEAYRPLAEDVSENAYAAAFRDPRFNPLQASELEDLTLSISVLSPAQPMSFSSEQDLLQQIRPGIDGLILEHGYHRGTFLPSVWEQLPNPVEFLRHLKQKAGLPADFWADDIRISRYQTESFE
jgi:AmmeMemoRadiSam system protein A